MYSDKGIVNDVDMGFKSESTVNEDTEVIFNHISFLTSGFNFVIQLLLITCSAMYGHLEVLKLLLSQLDIQPNERDNCGITPFMDAIKTGHIPIASLLLSTQKVYKFFGLSESIVVIDKILCDVHILDALCIWAGLYLSTYKVEFHQNIQSKICGN